MRYTPNRSRGPSDSDWSSDIARALSRRLVGQPAAIEAVVPYVEMYRAKLTPEGRPAGIFLLLGPTGTGKTKTVEALADVLHGSPKKLLKVDCGEYQMEHEVAKLLGAPPGISGASGNAAVVDAAEVERCGERELRSFDFAFR